MAHASLNQIIRNETEDEIIKETRNLFKSKEKEKKTMPLKIKY